MRVVAILKICFFFQRMFPKTRLCIAVLLSYVIQNHMLIMVVIVVTYHQILFSPVYSLN